MDFYQLEILIITLIYNGSNSNNKLLAEMIIILYLPLLYIVFLLEKMIFFPWFIIFIVKYYKFIVTNILKSQSLRLFNYFYVLLLVSYNNLISSRRLGYRNTE